MPPDPRESYSYRHPRSGEWAHPRGADPLDDAFRSYVDPAWALLGARVRETPAGPLGTGRAWRAVSIGFGRGFECVALLRRLEAEAPESRWEIAGLEPHPEWLAPWPPRWPGFAEHEAPWWGCDGRRFAFAGGARILALHARTAAEWLAGTEPGACDLFLLDLFSPGRTAEDWEDSLPAALAAAAAPGAVLSGYCCARVLREALRATGWEVERLRRPGLRDVLRARRPDSGRP